MKSQTNINDLLEKVNVILSSNTIYRTALINCIEAFHHAMVTEAHLNDIKHQIEQIVFNDVHDSSKESNVLFVQFEERQ